MTLKITLHRKAEDGSVEDIDVPVKAEGLMFFYDGCHKIYLATSEEGRQRLFNNGWSQEDLHHPSELPAVWEETCPLRFISDADLKRMYVDQDEDSINVTVEWTDESTINQEEK